MATAADDSKRPRSNAKPYQKPDLVKGPVLAKITAQPPISGVQTPCWVARAAFGEADIRWLIFRAWLLDDAPAWFRRFYLRHGETVGAWVGRYEVTRTVMRACMLPAVRRKALR